MRRLTLSLAVLSLAMLAYETSAGEPGKRPDRERGAAAEGQRKGREGQRAGSPAQRDPQQMVARMMEEFDKDGDQKLNVSELTALLQSMRERRAGQGTRPGGRSGQGGPGAQGQRRRGGPEAGGRGRPDGAAKPGGQRPKRPDAE